MMSQIISGSLHRSLPPSPPIPIPTRVPKPITTIQSDDIPNLYQPWPEEFPDTYVIKQVNLQPVKFEYVNAYFAEVHSAYVPPHTPSSLPALPNPHPPVPIQRRGPESPTQPFHPRMKIDQDAAIPGPANADEEERSGAKLVRRSCIRGKHLRSRTCSDIITRGPESDWVIVEHPTIEKPLPPLPRPDRTHNRARSCDNTAQPKPAKHVRFRPEVDVVPGPSERS
ncbi:hypothetical protein OBBRIDRAFT_884917 [Obba rivulosa]|uniref:Uncharacterized protein n=1 Tax=Obba rivulosa TaxID=1052685 RepID=A0A8E2DRA2_9APHY|nr:hypothetical protein OBBRIDRAFT_884917 [Obba rivulosa]